MRQEVLKLSRLLELKRIFGLCTFAKNLRLYLKNSWSRFAKNCPVGIFCEIMKSNLVDDDDFTSFYQVLERMIFSAEEHDGWVSLSPFWPLSTLKLLGEQTLDSWSKLELKFSQIRKWTNEIMLRGGAYQRSHFSWTIFQNDTDKKVVRYTTWWNPVTIRSHFSTM